MTRLAPTPRRSLVAMPPQTARAFICRRCSCQPHTEQCHVLLWRGRDTAARPADPIPPGTAERVLQPWGFSNGFVGKQTGWGCVSVGFFLVLSPLLARSGWGAPCAGPPSSERGRIGARRAGLSKCRAQNGVAGRLEGVQVAGRARQGQARSPTFHARAVNGRRPGRGARSGTGTTIHHCLLAGAGRRWGAFSGCRWAARAC